MVTTQLVTQYLRAINKSLPVAVDKHSHRPFYEADVHDALIEAMTKDGIVFRHEYYCEDTRYKLDFYFPENRIGIELKVGIGNVPRVAVTELLCALPYCQDVILAHYHQWAPVKKRLSVWQVSIDSGIQLRIPMSKVTMTDFSIGVLGNVNDPVVRGGWPSESIMERYWAAAISADDIKYPLQGCEWWKETPAQAIQRMHFPEVR